MSRLHVRRGKKTHSFLWNARQHNCVVVTFSLPLCSFPFSRKKKQCKRAAASSDSTPPPHPPICGGNKHTTASKSAAAAVAAPTGGSVEPGDASSPQEHSRDVSSAETTLILLLWDGKDRVPTTSHGAQPRRRQEMLRGDNKGIRGEKKEEQASSSRSSFFFII